MSRAERRHKARLQAKRKYGRKKGFLSMRATRLVVLAMVVVLVLSITAWGFVSYTSNLEARRTVLRVVNGQEVTRFDLVRRANVLRYIYGLSEIDPALEEALLEGLIDERLVAAEADGRGLAATEEDFAVLEQQIAAALDALYTSSLGATAQRIRLGVSQADLRAYEKSLILDGKLYEDVTAEVTVTEEDILALYQEYKETLDEAGLSLNEARDKLAEDALQKKRGEVYAAFLEELRARAVISTPG